MTSTRRSTSFSTSAGGWDSTAGCSIRRETRPSPRSRITARGLRSSSGSPRRHGTRCSGSGTNGTPTGSPSSLGIPIPRTWYASTVDELAQIQADGPFAMKPAIKEHFVYATKAKAWRANTTRRVAAAVRARRRRTSVSDEVMIQDLIPGGGEQQFAYCAFFKDGRSLASMVVRRRRQHPPEFGRASTFVEAIELPILETLSERFLRAINYYGLVELEYKLDPRDGQYKLLDVNGRTWGYHTLGIRRRRRFPVSAVRGSDGRSDRARRGRAGVSWIRLVTDLPTGDRRSARTAARIGESTCDRSGMPRSRPSSTARIPLPGLMELSPHSVLVAEARVSESCRAG